MLKVIIRNFEGIELFFQKWNYYKLNNQLIEDEILDIKRKLNSNDCYLFIASLVRNLLINYQIKIKLNQILIIKKD